MRNSPFARGGCYRYRRPNRCQPQHVCAVVPPQPRYSGQVHAAYGVNHKRTEGQFETAWKELQQALPKGRDTGFLLGVSDNKLLLDGIPLEAGQAERSFAQLLTAAGLSSIMSSNQVTLDDFTRLVRAFAMGGSKAQDFAKQMKRSWREQRLLHPHQRGRVRGRRSGHRGTFHGGAACRAGARPRIKE